MQGAYGGLIVILIYATMAPPVDNEVYLIAQDGSPLLTDAGLNIDVNQ